MRYLTAQLLLTGPWIAHAHAVVLAAMSALLDEQPVLGARVQQELNAGCPANARTERPGLSGEQTLLLMIVRQLTGWTYAELDFHRRLDDVSRLLSCHRSSGHCSRSAG